MKLLFADPGFVLFASDELDTEDDEPTRPDFEPPSSSPMAGLVEYASEVRIRAAERAENVARRRRLA